jgi:hypothetical protein
MKMAVFWVVDWYEFTDVSEVCTASIIRVTHRPDDGESDFVILFTMTKFRILAP